MPAGLLAQRPAGRIAVQVADMQLGSLKVKHLGAHVEPGALGLSVAALVGIYLSDTADQDAVTQALSRLDEVEDCWFVAGDESFVLKVRVADVPELERMLSRLRKIRGLSRTRTTVVLSTKWEGRAARPFVQPT